MRDMNDLGRARITRQAVCFHGLVPPKARQVSSEKRSVRTQDVLHHAVARERFGSQNRQKPEDGTLFEVHFVKKKRRENDSAFKIVKKLTGSEHV